MKPGALLRLPLPLLAAFTGLGAATAASRPKASPELSVSGLVGYDDNLYAVDSGRLAQVESGFSTVSARIAVAPAAGLSLAYAPALTTFFDESRENHAKHLLSSAWKQKAGALSWTAATEFAYVSGDERGVDYGPGCGNAFSTAVPRERREQWQNKSDLALRHDSSAGFVRAVGKLQYWDMLTRPVSGANYVDRHEVHGGLDFGRALRAGGPEFYLGYRRGYQFQDRDAKPASPRHASNHYDRAFVGLEGKLSPAWKVAAQVGGSRHVYPDDPAVYAGSSTEQDLFTDITLTWSATEADDLQVKTSQARSFSTTGTNSLLTSTYQIAWKHRFSRAWSATLTGRFAEAEYAPAARDDLAYAILGSVVWQIDDHVSCTFSVSREIGRDHHNGISGGASELRDFDRCVVSIGLGWKL